MIRRLLLAALVALALFPAAASAQVITSAPTAVLFQPTLNSLFLGPPWPSASTGTNNTGVGFQSLATLTTGRSNTAMGYYALHINDAGNFNTAFGEGSARFVTSDNNTAIGFEALHFTSTGDSNVAVGHQVLATNTTGSSNVGIGYWALENANLGINNTAVGALSLFDLTAPSHDGQNTVVGYNSGRGIISGVNNTIIGANVTGLSSALGSNVILADGQGNIRFQDDGAGNIYIKGPALRLGGADAASPVAQSLQPQSVVAGTSNTAGATLTIAGSQSTGSAVGGSIIFRTSPAGGAGTAQNALSTALTIAGSGNATFAGSLTSIGNLFVGASSEILLGSNARIDALASGNVMLSTSGGSSGFGLLQFGGTTNSFAAIGNSGSNTIVERADGTAGGVLAASGALMVGSATPLTLATGEVGMAKITASGSAPGAAGAKLAVVCGTNAGTAKLIMYAGTSTTPVTVLDNVGAGVTGC